MAKQKLTSRTVDAATPQAQRYEINDTEIPGFVLRVSPEGTKTFFLLFRAQDGQRRRLKLGRADILTAVQARDMAKGKLLEVANGADPAKERKEKREDMTLGEWLDEAYAPWAKANLKSFAPTLRHCRVGFAPLLGKKLRSLSGFEFERHRVQRSNTPLEGRSKAPKAATLNREIATLRAALTKAVDWGHLPSNPMARVTMTKEDRKATVRYLSAEEEARLLETLRKRDDDRRAKRARFNLWRMGRGFEPLPSHPLPYSDHFEPLILLSLHSGMRKGEAFGLQWGDVDLVERRLTVRGDGAKSGSTRHIDLNQIAVDALTAWKAQGTGTGLVFPGKEGAKLDNVTNGWGAILKAAEITGFRWHDLRHTFASKLVQRGVDLSAVRELLGHGDFKMTLRYAHLRPQDRRRAVDALVDVDNVIAFPEQEATTSEG